MALSETVAIANLKNDAIRAEFNGAIMRVYGGTEPANIDTALSGNTLLASLTFGNPAFPVSSAGVLTANAITQDASADANGTATFFRVYKSDGTTPLMQGTIGVEATINNSSIVLGGVVQCTSFTYTQPR